MNAGGLFLSLAIHYVWQSRLAVIIIESFKPPLLKVGVRKRFPVYRHAPWCDARHSIFYIKLPFTVQRLKLNMCTNNAALMLY